MRARQSFDGAYFAVGRHDAKIGYMFDICDLLYKITGYDIESLLKKGWTLNPEEFGSRQMEHKLGEKLVKRLQTEVAELRAKDAESTALVKQLKNKISDLENVCLCC